MATNNPPPSSSSSKIKNSNEEEQEEEDYINMEVTSSSSSPQISREFEFQMSSVSINDKDTTTATTSPADELFYRGKLLPLHLPPRLEMVQKLLQTSKNIESFQVVRQEEEEESSSISTKNLTNTRTPFEPYNISSSKIGSFEVEEERFSISTKNLISTNTTTSTPFDQSCNISPSESCRVSCELNPDEYFFEWSTEFSTFFKDNPTKMKSWSKKLKLVKQSLISQKLKASTSKAYLNLKSLFNKSACSDQEVSNGTTKDCSNKYTKVCKRTPFGHVGKCTQNSPTLASVIRDIDEDNVNSHRRSFSAAIKKHSPTKCLSSSSSNGSSSSSSFSLNSNGFYELNFLKRSSSATTEIEGSIEAAIAHCKKSQELCINPKRKMIEAGINSLSISKIAATEIQERPDLCRF
ncbi:hypothetical protein RND71_031828 [Anisodus tanguticus]|uniref:Membrane-associated kinase regulator 4 n=1 Tax=Anisodus tanguticus TaxID=243964 RepID=A0AAE1UXU7_9SOLA|nr:hypothetical protein RND71_031828 [Anisodus tanguticus]